MRLRSCRCAAPHLSPARNPEARLVRCWAVGTPEPHRFLRFLRGRWCSWAQAQELRCRRALVPKGCHNPAGLWEEGAGRVGRPLAGRGALGAGAGLAGPAGGGHPSALPPWPSPSAALCPPSPGSGGRGCAGTLWGLRDTEAVGQADGGAWGRGTPPPAGSDSLSLLLLL